MEFLSDDAIVQQSEALLARLESLPAAPRDTGGFAEKVETLTRLPVPSPHLKELSAFWNRNRARIAVFWLAAWRELQNRIDPTFDFGAAPARNVAPPAGSIRRAGSAPETIEDPEHRRQYEELLARNHEAAERYNSQQELHRLAPDFRSRMVDFLSAAYALPPDHTAELTAMMLSNALAEPLQREILQRARSLPPDPRAR